ncbi:MAG: RNA polymerase sigma factor [Sandaracinaceae bacterium]
MKPAGQGVNEAPQGPSKAKDGPGSPGQAQEVDVDDRTLVARVQEGDEQAFRMLFDRYHRRAYAVAYGVVKNKQDALDIVQDGFVKVHRHIGNFQGTSSFYTWLYRIIMNLAIDHVRRRKNNKGVEYDDGVGRDDDELAGDGALLPRLMDSNPAKTVIRRELLENIQRALDELPEYHRAVILLREVEGMSYEEMSQVLGVPKGTIMSRLFHARKKMQASLSEYMQGELNVEG